MTGLAVIRCHRDFHDMLASAVPFVTNINKRACVLRTVHVGGTSLALPAPLTPRRHHQGLPPRHPAVQPAAAAAAPPCSHVPARCATHLLRMADILTALLATIEIDAEQLAGRGDA